MSASAQTQTPRGARKKELEFFSIRKNKEGKLIASNLHEIPEDLLNNLKDRVRANAATSLEILVDSEKMPPADLKQIENQVAQQQLQLIIDYVGRCARNAEVRAQHKKEQTRKEIEQTRKALELSRKKTEELKNAQAKELVDLNTKLKEKSEEDTRMYHGELTKVKNKHQTLKEQNEKLGVLTLAHSTDETFDEKNAEVVEKISEYKKISAKLSKKLIQVEKKTVRNEKEEQEITEKIKNLESELHKTRTNKMVAAAKTRAKEESIINLNKELQDIQNSIEKIKKERKCFLEQREILLEEENRAVQALGNMSQADCANEIIHLQESAAMNRAKIAKLRLELSNAYDKICQTEEELENIKEQQRKNCNFQTQIKGKYVAEFLEKQTEIYKLDKKVKRLKKMNEQQQILRVKEEEIIANLKTQIGNLKH